MIKSINGVIKMLTEMGVSLYDDAFNEPDSSIWQPATAKLSLVTEQLASIKGTSDDSEFVRIQRIYYRRRKEDLF